MLELENSEPGEPLLLHDEPIYLNKTIIGSTTSGNYSFNYKKNIAFGYIETHYSLDELTKNKLFIEVEKLKYAAKLLKKPLNKGLNK